MSLTFIIVRRESLPNLRIGASPLAACNVSSSLSEAISNDPGDLRFVTASFDACAFERAEGKNRGNSVRSTRETVEYGTVDGWIRRMKYDY